MIANNYSADGSHGPLGERREPILVLLLSLITCGIYYFYFIYIVSAETKNYLQDDNDSSPSAEVLYSILTCWFYTIYWDYKMGRKIAMMQQRAGVFVTDNSVLYLVLNIVGLGVLPSMIQQGHLNEIWAKHRRQGD
jgi:hypothetical protein